MLPCKMIPMIMQVNIGILQNQSYFLFVNHIPITWEDFERKTHKLSLIREMLNHLIVFTVIIFMRWISRYSMNINHEDIFIILAYIFIAIMDRTV